MKTLFALTLFLAASVSAQTFAVRWTGANTNGTPVYWPIIMSRVADDWASPGTNIVKLTALQLYTVIATNRPAWDAAQAAEQAAVQAQKVAGRVDFDGALAAIFAAAANIKDNTASLTILQLKAQATIIQLNALKILTNAISQQSP